MAPFVANVREALEEAGAELTPLSSPDAVTFVFLPLTGEDLGQVPACPDKYSIVLLTTQDFLMAPDGSRLERNLGLGAGMGLAARLRQNGEKPLLLAGHWQMQELARRAVEAAKAAEVVSAFRVACQNHSAHAWSTALLTRQPWTLPVTLLTADWQSGRLLLNPCGAVREMPPARVMLTAVSSLADGPQCLLTEGGDLTASPELPGFRQTFLFRTTLPLDNFLVAWGEAGVTEWCLTSELSATFLDDLRFFLSSYGNAAGFRGLC